MPVRSLLSSVHSWPDVREVDQAVRQWAEQMGRRRAEVLRIGYFGSYARGDWGVGSDLDLIIVVERADQPFVRRGAQWDVTELPVPADVLVYTQSEWDLLARQGSRFYRTVIGEGCWVWERRGAGL